MNIQSSIKEQSIVITGFMGVGKTTVGKVLAESMTRPFIDMDVAIEEEEGASIQEIFAQKGEAYFRQCEARFVNQIASLTSYVIATGGGTFVQWENHEKFASYQAFIVCLEAPFSEILKRLTEHPYRPLVSLHHGNEKSLKELYESRQLIYRRIPTHIDTALKTPRQVAVEIISSFVPLSSKTL